MAVKVQSKNRTQVELDQELLHELVETLRDVRPAEVILFGSRAKRRSAEDSDIDLVVILDTQNSPRTYAEALRNRMTVNRSLRALRARVAIDLLVYTLDEWKKLQEVNSSFVREIRETGLRIL
ncbi:MAG: nucleotidyltransferase domain-containing protein [Calditrichaeota bacterium]|nr:nucleotidyltransferase domain-containing protein [Calditrichota bacterium]